MMLQYAQFLCFLGSVVKGAAGTCIALDVYLPPTFFFFFYYRKKKILAYFNLLPEQSDMLPSPF